MNHGEDTIVLAETFSQSVGGMMSVETGKIKMVAEFFEQSGGSANCENLDHL